MRRKWKISEVTFIRENNHLTSKELAAHFGCTKNSIAWLRKANDIRKYNKLKVAA